MIFVNMRFGSPPGRKHYGTEPERTGSDRSDTDPGCVIGALLSFIRRSCLYDTTEPCSILRRHRVPSFRVGRGGRVTMSWA
jgi:hypothetical protein